MKDQWLIAPGFLISDGDMFSQIDSYISLGGKIYIGTDSQLGATGCTFVTAICLHKNIDPKYGTYFFTRKRVKNKNYKTLRVRIMKEVQGSVDIGLMLLERYPESDIEIHVDIGKTQRSNTRIFVDTVRGWLTGAGFGCKIKPNSWASSSVADHHTK